MIPHTPLSSDENKNIFANAKTRHTIMKA